MCRDRRARISLKWLTILALGMLVTFAITWELPAIEESQRKSHLPIQRPFDRPSTRIYRALRTRLFPTESCTTSDQTHPTDTPQPMHPRRPGNCCHRPGLRFQNLKDAFARLGLDISQIRIVLVTHRHADHWFAARELVQATGAKVMALREEVEWLRTPADLRSTIRSTRRRLHRSRYYPMSSRSTTDKSSSWEIFGSRSSPRLAIQRAARCFSSEIHGYSVFWSGDTIMTLDPEALDGDYMTRLGPRFGGDLRAYAGTLKRISQSPVDILLPGHPLLGSRFDPFVGTENWSRLLMPKVDAIELRLRQDDAHAGRFLDGVGKALTADVFYLGESKSTASYVIKTENGLICLDPGSRTVAEISSQFGIAWTGYSQPEVGLTYRTSFRSFGLRRHAMRIDWGPALLRPSANFDELLSWITSRPRFATG